MSRVIVLFSSFLWMLFVLIVIILYSSKPIGREIGFGFFLILYPNI